MIMVLRNRRQVKRLLKALDFYDEDHALECRPGLYLICDGINSVPDAYTNALRYSCLTPPLPTIARLITAGDYDNAFIHLRNHCFSVLGRQSYIELHFSDPFGI